jgi:hypothetical protein
MIKKAALNRYAAAIGKMIGKDEPTRKIVVPIEVENFPKEYFLSDANVLRGFSDGSLFDLIRFCWSLGFIGTGSKAQSKFISNGKTESTFFYYEKLPAVAANLQSILSQRLGACLAPIYTFTNKDGKAVLPKPAEAVKLSLFGSNGNGIDWFFGFVAKAAELSDAELIEKLNANALSDNAKKSLLAKIRAISAPQFTQAPHFGRMRGQVVGGAASWVSNTLNT